MAWHPRQLAQQTGRTFVVTGANSGIGYETARALVERGAHVVLAVRDTAKGDKAAARLAGPGSTSVVEVDLSDLDTVARCAETLLGRHGLSALICNAGVMGGPFLLTPQGFERQMATNHLGHVALVAALWPLLDASASRVVVVSSGEARGGQLSPQTTREQLLNPTPYDGKQVYRNTKQANMLFAQELHRRCRKAGSPVSAVAVHPGAVRDQPVRPATRAGRSGPAGLCQRGCHQGAASVGRRRCAVHVAGARPQHAERRLRRPRRARPAPWPARAGRRLRIREGPGDGRAPLGAHRAGSRYTDAGLIIVDSPAG